MLAEYALKKVKEEYRKQGTRGQSYNPRHKNITDNAEIERTDAASKTDAEYRSDEGMSG